MPSEDMHTLAPAPEGLCRLPMRNKAQAVSHTQNRPITQIAR